MNPGHASVHPPTVVTSDRLVIATPPLRQARVTRQVLSNGITVFRGVPEVAIQPLASRRVE